MAPRPAVSQMQNDLDFAYQEIRRLKVQVSGLTKQKYKILSEKEALVKKGQEDQLEIKGLNELLETQVKESVAGDTKSQQIISNHESDILKLERSLKFQKEQVSFAWDINNQRAASLRKRLQEEKQKVSELLSKEKDYIQNEKASEEKYTDLVEKFRKELDEKEQVWETKVRKIETEKKDLEEEFTKNLAETHHSWETKTTLLEVEFFKNLAVKRNSWEIEMKFLEAELKEVKDEKKVRVVNHHSLETSTHLMENKARQTEHDLAILVNEKQSWEAKAKQVEKEKKKMMDSFYNDMTERNRVFEITMALMEDGKRELEDVCLMMNKKRRGIFSRRRSEQRDVVLDRMKAKLREERNTETLDLTIDMTINDRNVISYHMGFAPGKQVLETQVKECIAGDTKSQQIISKHDSEILKLEKSLKFQKEQNSITWEINNQPCLRKRLQEEKQKVSELLSKEKDDIQNEKASQEKYTDLEEKFRKELAEKEQVWETKVRKMDAEKKDLEEKFYKALAETHHSWGTKIKLMEVEKKDLKESL
ncbi:golgin subfamily A member 6-like protein 22 [Cottoperca gobio]|uniref:Golgin subfamily A member 6-like protein 22 n=1 Tax=Cottoperca gobio TaxID=56716 RepID=A0A6J2P8K5_COTGO|nr:golgin subfamily A member 6-like protein 22 [Cottoperca gobio]